MIREGNIMKSHVTYKIALKLRELGYNWEVHQSDGYYVDVDEVEGYSDDKDSILAPLWQELWYWLETKGYPTVIASNFYTMSIEKQEKVVLEDLLSDENCKKFLKYEPKR